MIMLAVISHEILRKVVNEPTKKSKEIVEHISKITDRLKREVIRFRDLISDEKLVGIPDFLEKIKTQFEEVRQIISLMLLCNVILIIQADGFKECHANDKNIAKKEVAKLKEQIISLKEQIISLKEEVLIIRDERIKIQTEFVSNKENTQYYLERLEELRKSNTVLRKENEMNLKNVCQKVHDINVINKEDAKKVEINDDDEDLRVYLSIGSHGEKWLTKYPPGDSRNSREIGGFGRFKGEEEENIKIDLNGENC